jgi:hypothetical protein
LGGLAGGCWGDEWEPYRLPGGDGVCAAAPLGVFPSSPGRRGRSETTARHLCDGSAALVPAWQGRRRGIGRTVAVYRSVRVKGDTMTRKSRRVLKLPTRAVQALRAHHTRQAAEWLAAGERWQEHDLVFCREDGTLLDRWHVRKEFQKITKAARLGRLVLACC